jgi:hypothetical protein
MAGNAAAPAAKARNVRRGNFMMLPPQSAQHRGHAIQQGALKGADYTGLARRWKGAMFLLGPKLTVFEEASQCSPHARSDMRVGGTRMSLLLLRATLLSSNFRAMENARRLESRIRPAVNPPLWDVLDHRIAPPRARMAVSSLKT